MCKEIEDPSSKHDTFNVHKKIKEATGRYKKRVPDTIKTNDGELVIEIEEKLNVWQKYMKKLFEDTESPQREYFPKTEGPEITQSEIKYAIKTAKGGKALGPYEIPVKLPKVMEENSIQLLMAFFNKIHDTGVISNEWLVSTFVTIPKKSHSRNCKDFERFS
ncbi:hypothetical protein ILUMI_17773 [Ignelater luminosus]|uniref:Uncharacterized protein n=1 Tax=Ignelater luminosus TaxID=2038154 RepID=A0A8K0CRM2_IGNLU|nr:hypothetical protein ILUMI_17773 [Ignelater luminosus]